MFAPAFEQYARPKVRIVRQLTTLSSLTPRNWWNVRFVGKPLVDLLRQMLGLATGPMMGGAVVSSGDYDAILWLGMALYATAVALILPPVLARARVAEPDLS